MDKNDLTRHMEFNLMHQIEMIRAADMKASIVFVFFAAMTGILASALSNMDKIGDISCCTITTGILLIMGFVSIAVSTFPRTKCACDSLLYCKSIAKRKITKFQEETNNLNSDIYLKDLVNQTYINATIASAKHRWVKCGMIFLFVSVIPWVVSLYQLHSSCSS